MQNAECSPSAFGLGTGSGIRFLKPFKNGNCLSVPEAPGSAPKISTNQQARKQPNQRRREFFHFRLQKLDSTISRWRSLDFFGSFFYQEKNERAKREEAQSSGTGRGVSLRSNLYAPIKQPEVANPCYSPEVKAAEELQPPAKPQPSKMKAVNLPNYRVS
ncbi:hypothetical protein FUA23_05205 [Neolewinella aurantiaca]|uniref:Uncharacterized protein n=1 Tax=Neolewinella aurantiaca TaxID=2602767 RepID=A0A5C7FZT9_9BACT|nr:hypothetical protein [Neolewinella aurantiaca]TXF90838.1 hypothetical protein FUA23_05205 [Neolewinella aurantiaca]